MYGESDQLGYLGKWTKVSCKYHRGEHKKNTGLGCQTDQKRKQQVGTPVENRNKETLSKIIKGQVKPGSKMYTDGCGAYNYLNKDDHQHFISEDMPKF